MNKFKKLMNSLGAVATLLTLIAYLLYKFTENNIFEILLITFFTTAFHLDIRILIGKIVPLYKNGININSKYFKLKNFESILYQKLNVKKWKTKTSAYEPAEFDLKLHTLDEIRRNMCNAEIVHVVNAIASYIPLLFIIPFGSPVVFIITSILASVFDLQFVIIQRYNRPRIIKVLKKNEDNY